MLILMAVTYLKKVRAGPLLLLLLFFKQHLGDEKTSCWTVGENWIEDVSHRWLNMLFGKHSPSAHVQFYLILQDIFQLVEKLFSYHVENHWVRQDYTTKTSREWEMKELLRFGDFPSSFYHLLSNVIEISVTYRLKEGKDVWMRMHPQMLAAP